MIRSYTSGAKKFGCHRETIKYWLNKRNIKRRCKKKVPFYKEGQDKFAQRQCGYLHYKFKKKQFIIDDESYFTLKNKHFFSNDVNLTPDDVKCKKKRGNLNLKFYFGLQSLKMVCQNHTFKTVEWQLTKKYIKLNV